MEHSKAPSILSTAEWELPNITIIPDKNADVEQQKPGKSLIVGDSMIAGLREAKLSRNRKSVCSLFSWSKTERFALLFSSFAEEKAV